MSADIDTWYALTKDYVATDPTKFFTYEQSVQSLDADGGGIFGLRPFVAARGDFVSAALASQVVVIGGDGICDGGEVCDADCGAATCAPCSTYDPARARCVPNCAGECTCPTDGPAPLVCMESTAWCVPQCTSHASCPPNAPHCDLGSGICEP